jgi:hypothetical protein
MSLLTLWIDHGDSRSRIILDSGALAHIFNKKNCFTQLELGEFDVIKTGKADSTLPIAGRGMVGLKWGDTAITLENCLYVPDIVINLISAGGLNKKGCTLESKSSRFSVSKNNLTVLRGKILKNLYTVDNPFEVGN